MSLPPITVQLPAELAAALHDAHNRVFGLLLAPSKPTGAAVELIQAHLAATAAVLTSTDTSGPAARAAAVELRRANRQLSGLLTGDESAPAQRRPLLKSAFAAHVALEARLVHEIERTTDAVQIRRLRDLYTARRSALVPACIG
jgi:hypothetical protein